jgi:hypothetical protein
MIASVLTAKSTNAVMTIATGVFIATSLLRIYRPSFRVEDEPTLNAARYCGFFAIEGFWQGMRASRSWL